MLKISVIGNLGANATLQQGNFQSFVSFNIAHSESFTRRDGTAIANTQWVSCVINWDCSRIMPYLVKGAKVYVYGALRTRIFTDRQGEVRCGLECIVQELELCGGARPETNMPAEQVKSQNPFNDGASNQENSKEPF